MDITNEQIVTEFKRQVYLCSGIGRNEMLKIINEQFSKQKFDGAEIKLDRATLPKDGQPVKFQTQDEDWHEGYFIDEDDLFWINDDKWYPAFDILKWEPN